MSDENEPEIPDRIAELMLPMEIENMQNLDGWAVGTAVQLNEDGVEIERYEGAWVELMNGEGRAGNMGGVRFMWANDDGDYKEAYAYPSCIIAHGNEPCFFIESWDEPEQPFVGQAVPQ